jgi:hypothetical protein
VNARLLAISAAACIALALASAWLFGIALERAFLLAPVIAVLSILGVELPREGG